LTFIDCSLGTNRLGGKECEIVGACDGLRAALDGAVRAALIGMQATTNPASAGFGLSALGRLATVA